MKKKTIVIQDYKNYWVSDTKQGHLIKICHGNNNDVLEIDLRWANRKRDNSNRPVDSVKIKNFA